MFTILKQTLIFAVISTVGVIIAIILWKRWTNILDVLTYKDAISFFVENKPSSVYRGVIIRKAEIGGTYLISQEFLDEKDQIITRSSGVSYGRRVRVKNIDQELLEAFGDTDVIICT